MQRISIILLSIVLSVTATAAVYGQFTISIPKIPKIKKDKPASSDSSNSNEATVPTGQMTYEQNQAFNDLVFNRDNPKRRLVLAYMECYDKKHNLEHNQYRYGEDRRFSSNKEKIATLTNEQAELAQLERDLREIGVSDNGADDLRNPAIWLDIASNRQQYLQCVQADVPRAGECGKLDDVNQARVDIYKKELNELLGDAKSFNGDRGWYSPEFNEDWLLAAISPSRRQKLATKYGELYPCISGLLDEIQAAAKISLPKYTLYSYNTRSPADERVIRSAISDLNQAKVFKVGLEGPAWLIQKNSFGIPEKRYKHGAMWVKYSNWDHGYCQILWINVIQDYAGGGTWGSSYGNFIRSEPAGCPTK